MDDRCFRLQLLQAYTFSTFSTTSQWKWPQHLTVDSTGETDVTSSTAAFTKTALHEADFNEEIDHIFSLWS